MEEKRCRVCEITKPVAEFYPRSKASGGGRQSDCKECARKRTAIEKSEPIVLRDRMAVHAATFPALPEMDQRY